MAFTWHGMGEPAATQVEVTLRKQGEDTLLSLRHSGMGEDETWETLSAQFEEEWKGALENLQSVLETGLDLRLMRRPVLGVSLDSLDAIQAEKLGVPVKEGIYLYSVTEHSSAQAAGLQRGDVILSLGGKAIPDYNSLILAQSQHRAGDVVEVEIYRGAEKKTVSMKLGSRPAPDVPATPAALAEKLRAAHEKLNAELDEVLQGVSEEEASRHPAPGEWSVKENLAHLIWAERWQQLYAWSMVFGEDNVPWQDNNPVHQAPILAQYPTLADLVAEFKAAEAATEASAASVPESFVANKGSYTRLCQFYPGFEEHARDHFTQMRETLAAVRKI